MRFKTGAQLAEVVSSVDGTDPALRPVRSQVLPPGSEVPPADHPALRGIQPPPQPKAGVRGAHPLRHGRPRRPALFPAGPRRGIHRGRPPGARHHGLPGHRRTGRLRRAGRRRAPLPHRSRPRLPHRHLDGRSRSAVAGALRAPMCGRPSRPCAPPPCPAAKRSRPMRSTSPSACSTATRTPSSRWRARAPGSAACSMPVSPRITSSTPASAITPGTSPIATARSSIGSPKFRRRPLPGARPLRHRILSLPLGLLGADRRPDARRAGRPSTRAAPAPKVDVTTQGVDGFTLLARPSRSRLRDHRRRSRCASSPRPSSRSPALPAAGAPGLFRPVGKQPGAEGPISAAVSGRQIYVYGSLGAGTADELDARRKIADEAAQWSTYRDRLNLALPCEGRIPR